MVYAPLRSVQNMCHWHIEMCIRDRNGDGQFMYFDTLTYVPIDLEGINPSLMEPGQIRMLNEYHKAVYEKISPLLTEEERLWLKEETREI